MVSQRGSVESLRGNRSSERAATNMKTHKKMSSSELMANTNHNASMDCLIMPQPNAEGLVDMMKSD